MEKNQILRRYSGDFRSWTNSLSDLSAIVANAKSCGVPEDATFSLNCDHEGDQSFSIYWWEEETDEEYNKRLNTYKQAEQDRSVAEREEYLRLKAKYETPSNFDCNAR